MKPFRCTTECRSDVGRATSMRSLLLVSSPIASGQFLGQSRVQILGSHGIIREEVPVEERIRRVRKLIKSK